MKIAGFLRRKHGSSDDDDRREGRRGNASIH
jgi:hypothetical protein